MTAETSADYRSALDALAVPAAELAYELIPADVVALVGMIVLDTLGVAVAAWDEPVVRLVRDELTIPGRAELWGGGTAEPVAAALVNGIAAHALDYDDYAPGSGLHPSAPLLAALLAAAALQAERGHTVTGRDLVTAYVAGYEVQERLGVLLWPSHYARGFHTTGTVGTIGAAAGTARLLGAAPPQMGAALCLGATDAAGLKAMFGSMGKPYHAGRAAASGLRAARLAMRGMTVGTDAVFGPQGLVAAASDESGTDEVTTRFGAPWPVRDVLPKLSPSCFGTHAAIACAARLRLKIGGAHVDRVELTVPPVLLNVCAIPAPRIGLEGKFSLAYTTAATLLHGEVTVASFTDEAVRAESVVALASRVVLVPDDTLAKTATHLRVDLDDGRVLRAEHDAAQRLWVDDPEEMRSRIEGKFRELARDLPGREDLVTLLRAPDQITSVGALSALLAGAD